MADALTHFEGIFARAYSQLDGSIHILDAFNETQEENGDPKFTYNTLTEASDMGRFAIVLTVASMDDYFTRKYAEIMVKAIKKKGVNTSFTKMLEDAGLDLAGALELLAMERPYRKIRTLAQNYYQNYTTQSTGKIDKLFETVGISKLSSHAQRRSRRKTLITSVNELVKRRHKIVHSGDLTRTGKIQKIDARTVKRINDIKLFVECSNTHINAFLKQKS